MIRCPKYGSGGNSGSWHMSELNQDCNSVCSSVGLPCHDGDWGPHDEASLRQAITATGHNPDEYCDIYMAENYPMWPGIRPDRYCFWKQSEASQCDQATGSYYRLCLCQ